MSRIGTNSSYECEIYEMRNFTVQQSTNDKILREEDSDLQQKTKLRNIYTHPIPLSFFTKLKLDNLFKTGINYTNNSDHFTL